MRDYKQVATATATAKASEPPTVEFEIPKKGELRLPVGLLNSHVQKVLEV